MVENTKLGAKKGKNKVAMPPLPLPIEHEQQLNPPGVRSTKNIKKQKECQPSNQHSLKKVKSDQGIEKVKMKKNSLSARTGSGIRAKKDHQTI